MSTLFPDDEENLSVVVELPYEPMASVNACYRVGKFGKVYMRHEARMWKHMAKALFREELDKHGIAFTSPHLRIHLNARFPLKRGQKPDQTNFMKLFIDAIAEELGIDDHTIVNGDSVASHLKENGDGLLIYTVVQIDE